MKKKIFTFLEVLLLLILIKLVATFIINEIFIQNYEKGKYNINSIKILSVMNFPEGYIYHYNKGNILYKNEKYTEAIEEYYKALERNPPEKKECQIRINLALARLQALRDNEDSEEDKNKNIDILKSARNILCEKGCAGEKENNGHSEEAEKLKADIDRKLKELEENQNDDDDDNDEKKDDEKEKEENKEKESKDKKTKQAEEKLKQIQEQSLEERQKELEASDRLWNGDSSHIFYEGKRW